MSGWSRMLKRVFEIFHRVWKTASRMAPKIRAVNMRSADGRMVLELRMRSRTLFSICRDQADLRESGPKTVVVVLGMPHELSRQRGTKVQLQPRLLRLHLQGPLLHQLLVAHILSTRPPKIELRISSNRLSNVWLNVLLPLVSRHQQRVERLLSKDWNVRRMRELPKSDKLRRKMRSVRPRDRPESTKSREFLHQLLLRALRRSLPHHHREKRQRAMPAREKPRKSSVSCRNRRRKLLRHPSWSMLTVFYLLILC